MVTQAEAGDYGANPEYEVNSSRLPCGKEKVASAPSRPTPVFWLNSLRRARWN
jgi:hypothetical protein